MAECVVNELIAADPCYATLSPFLQNVVQAQMLCNLLDKIENGGAVTCDVQELLTQGKCFAAMPDYILRVTILQLLCDISNAL